jgi:large subunit ribosomal protein L11
LIKKEMGLEKAKTDTATDYVGNISLEQLLAVARKKRAGMLASTLKKAVKEVAGTCVSMRLQVEGKDPRVIQKEIDSGVYDEVLKE